MHQKVSSQVGEPEALLAQMMYCRRKGGAYVLREGYACATW